MNKPVLTALTATLSTPLLAAVFASLASAAQHDVSLAAAVDDNDFTITIVNDTSKQLEGDWYAKSADSDRLTSGGVVRAGDEANHAKRNVDDARYQVTWLREDIVDNQWGTDGLSDPQTAEPYSFTIGDGDDGGPNLRSGSLGRLFGSLGSLGSVR
ncbi:hypothetical protein [Rhodococcus sp. NPDC049939]|uniref:hypothetical protein n=1 Tax=Rhodococcus sp. NPDC049939 TaxID=3155511 RepID=UPI0033E22985